MLAQEVSDHDVGQTVAVGVAEGDSHVGLGNSLTVDRDPEPVSYILKCAIAAVVPEGIAFCSRSPSPS